MRTLHATLTAAQKTASRQPYLRIHFDDRGENGNTVTYTTRDDTNRIYSVEQWEEPYAGVAIIRLKNYDQALSAVDYRGYSVSIGWGLVLDDTPDANWYSNAAVMKVIRQRDISFEGELLTEFYCVSIWAEIASHYIIRGGNRLTGAVVGTFQIGELVTGAPSGATGRLNTVSGTYIVVTRVTGVFAAGDTCTGGTSGAACSGIAAPTTDYGGLVYASGDTTTEVRIESLTTLTVDVDEDDPDGSMADAPKLEVAAGTSTRAVIRRMLLRTKCGMRYENDGHLHVLYLDTTDAAQYEFQTDHAFFEDLRDRAIIVPNTVFFVDKLPDTSTGATYVGTANDPVSVAAIGTIEAPIQVDPDIESNGEGNTRAAAWISQMIAQAYQGKITAPMECGLEVYDVVQAVDTRLNVTSKGRVGRIERYYRPLEGVYIVAMTLGSLYSEPGAMDVNADSVASDMKDLMSDLDRFPPRLRDLIHPWQIPPGSQAYIADIDFTSVDQDHISWTAGNVKLADGRIQAVTDTGSPLALTATHYLYVIWGNSTLQNSTTYSDAIGSDRMLVAVASKASTDAQKAYVLNPHTDSILINTDKVMDGLVTSLKLGDEAVEEAKIKAGAVTGGKIAALSIVGGHIQALQIDTGHINTGAITTNRLDAGAVTAIKIDVATLDAISANVGTLTAGTINGVTIIAGAGHVTLDASGITIDGALLLFYDGVNSRGMMGASATGVEIWTVGAAASLKLNTGTGGVITARVLTSVRMKLPVGANLFD